MKTTNANLLMIRNAMNKFGGASGTLAYAIMKTRNTIDNELKAFEQYKNELFNKYGEEKDGQIVVKEENQEVFLKEMNEILEESIEFEPHRISKEKFDKGLPDLEEWPDLKLIDIDIVEQILVER